jgi:hypothetical protein
MSAPFIDKRVKHVGVSKLREMTCGFLRQMSQERLVYVLQDNDEPLAVILSYEMFMQIQGTIEKLERESGGKP